MLGLNLNGYLTTTIQYTPARPVDPRVQATSQFTTGQRDCTNPTFQ